MWRLIIECQVLAVPTVLLPLTASLMLGPLAGRARAIGSTLESIIVRGGASGSTAGGIRCRNRGSQGKGTKPVHR